MTKPLLFHSLTIVFILSYLVTFSESRRLPHHFLPKTTKSGLFQHYYTYEIRYFEQTLDHFSFHDLPSFQQRYLINTYHWVGPSSPIFLYCGNEGDIEWFAANTGFLWELAPRFGAMVIFPEVSNRPPTSILLLLM